MTAPVRSFAPGRVNLIGEHTDYNDGLALPFAVAAGVTVLAWPAAGGRVQAQAADLGERDAFPVAAPAAASGWRAFVRGAVAELHRAGIEVPAAQLRIAGTIPRGAGLSSSAALSVALCLALIELARGPRPDDVTLARIAQAIEHRWVGARTGLLDPLACLGGRADHALRIDFRSLERRPVPLRLGAHRLVVLESGEVRRLGESGYNDRRDECAEACRRLGVRSLRDATLADAAGLAEPLDRRVAHVVQENARVDAAVRALADADLAALGRLLDASHRSLRDDYAVSTPAVEAAVARLHAAGALGARVVGGGFGGAVLGLLPPGAVPPDGALEVRPGPGASVSGWPGA